MSTLLFNRFGVFTNDAGEMEVYDTKEFMLFTNKETGKKHLQNIKEFKQILDLMFTKEEQIELLKNMAPSEEEK